MLRTIKPTQWRPMNAGERHMENFFNQNYIQMAFEVEDPKDMPPLLQKLKRALAGLYLKTDEENLIRNTVTENTVPIHHIPKRITNLPDACDFVHRHLTPFARYALASIAADETRVVVNSSHAVTDGGFFAGLLKDLLDENASYKFDHINTMPGDLKNDIMKKQFDEFERNKSKYEKNWPKYNLNDLTYFDKQEMVAPPYFYEKEPPRLKTEVKSEDLAVYNKSNGKVQGLSEYLWLGLCMSINAKMQRFGNIGLMTCMDFRRMLPKSAQNAHLGNAFTNFILMAKNANPRNTISEICAELRSNFKNLEKNDWFYEQYLHPPAIRRNHCSLAHVSNVGPLFYKSPFKDFNLQVFSIERGTRSIIQVTSYSKINKEKGINNVDVHMRYSPWIMGHKSASDIFNSYVYFLKNIKPDMIAGDALDELIHFQESLQ